MSEHTPTPWRVEQGTGLVWGNCSTFDDGTPDKFGVPVTDGQLERPWAKGQGPTYEEMEANAAFIVRAVNAHAQLVAALERLIEVSHSISEEQTDAIASAHAVLASLKESA
jgi:hypothetical protein